MTSLRCELEVAIRAGQADERAAGDAALRDRPAGRAENAPERAEPVGAGVAGGAVDLDGVAAGPVCQVAAKVTVADEGLVRFAHRAPPMRRSEWRPWALTEAELRLDLRQGNLPADLEIRKFGHHCLHERPLIFGRPVVDNRLNHGDPTTSAGNGTGRCAFAACPAKRSRLAIREGNHLLGVLRLHPHDHFPMAWRQRLATGRSTDLSAEALRRFLKRRRSRAPQAPSIPQAATILTRGRMRHARKPNRSLPRKPNATCRLSNGAAGAKAA